MDRVAKTAANVERTAFFFLFGLIPLLLTPYNYELFEYNKMMAAYALMAVIGVAWIVSMVGRRQIRVPKTPLDLPILLFGLSQLISGLFSIDPHVSWLGYYSRFNGGIFSVAGYILLYYAFIDCFGTSAPKKPEPVAVGKSVHEKKHQMAEHKKRLPEIVSRPVMDLPPYIGKFFGLALITGAVVAGYGVAERLGIDKNLWVQDVQNRVFSSLGQPNWLAAYLVALLPVVWAFAIGNYRKTGDWKGIPPLGWPVTVGANILFFFVLLCTRSRSGLLAFAVADVLFWIITTIRLTERKTLVKPFLILHAFLLAIVIFNGTYVESVDKYVTLQAWINRLSPKSQTIKVAPAAATVTGPSLETGGTESGLIRKYVWEAAVYAWRSSVKTILIGTGTETFAFAFYQHKPVGHNLTSEWDFLYNKAHNEYLNYLATTGILGLGTYLAFIAVSVVVFIKTALRRDISEKAVLMDAALFSGWISILITNFFGFSVVVIQLMFFLFPATAYLIGEFGKNTTEDGEKALFSFPVPNIIEVQYGAVGGAILIGIVLLSRLWTFWNADRTFATGYRLDKVGQYAQAYPYLTEAVKANPNEPLYRDERSSALSTLSLTAIENNQATLAAQLAQDALSENEASLMISPNNVNFWKTRTKILYALSGIDAGYVESAITALKHAFTLSPNDPKIAYNLAILNARIGDKNATVDYFNQAKTLKPDYHDAYKGLYLYYTEIKEPDKATAILNEYLTKVDARDIEFNKILKGQQ